MRLLYNRLTEEQKFLISILKPHKFAILLFLSGSLLTSLFDGISIGLMIPALAYLQGAPEAGELPKVLQWVPEAIMNFPKEEQLLLSVGFVILAVLIKNFLLGLTYKQGAWLSNRVTADVRSKAVTTLMRVGIDFHHKSKLGELIEKAINYTLWLREFILHSMYFCVFLFILMVLLFLLVALSWQLTAIALVLGVFCAAFMSRYMKGLPKLGEQSAKAGRELTAAFQESLGAVRLIQACSQESHQIEMLNTNIRGQLNADNKLAFRHSWIQPLTEGLGVIAIGALLAISLSYSLVAGLQIAVIIPCLYLLVRATTTLKILSDSRGIIRSRRPYLELVYDLIRMDNKPFIADGHKEFRRLERQIRFQSVSFSYDNDDKYALQDINFTIPKGKITAIVGKSGAGKSTLVNLLLRFYDPRQGAILIDDQPLQEFQLASYRQKIGVVSQDSFIFNETVKYNIAFGMNEPVSDNRIIEAAQQAGASEFICQLPDGYDTVLGDRGVKLSGGQRQRISIARAILKDPEILILDEATSSLDTVTEKSIHDAITELSRNRTVIIVAHRLSTIRNADQVIVLRDARVAESGSPEYLLQTKSGIPLVGRDAIAMKKPVERA